MKYGLAHVACALLALTVAGCLSPRGDSAEVHTYQLSLDRWLSGTRSGESDGPVLLVSQPQAEPGFETQRMVYIKRPYELEYYAVNQWAETPVRMFAPLMVQVLNQSGVDLKESTILSTRAFEVVENAMSENPYGGVQAANRAVAALLDRIGLWLRQCVPQSPECNR
ncbi:MAG: membrane integrity-associated transporter subunit PqiC [Nitrospirae bacterium]|nr:membrane integrity-associated transporter subunit PqiC [Nitrospirota bacterium]